MQSPSIPVRFGIIVCAVASCAFFAYGQDKDVKMLSSTEVMRKKLEISKNILEGLATSNFDVLAMSAKSLKDLTDAPALKSPMLRDAESYPELIQDFRRPLEEMAKQAKAKNIDGVTLAYVQMTMSCVSCHKFIRDGKNAH